MEKIDATSRVVHRQEWLIWLYGMVVSHGMKTQCRDLAGTRTRVDPRIPTLSHVSSESKSATLNCACWLSLAIKRE